VPEPRSYWQTEIASTRSTSATSNAGSGRTNSLACTGEVLSHPLASVWTGRALSRIGSITPAVAASVSRVTRTPATVRVENVHPW
jgi:hypothetical protein